MARVIIAEDVDYVRATYARYIRDITGERPDEVANGRDLVEKVRENNYVLVITDNGMPFLYGVEAIKKIRVFNPEVPICMFSGEPSVEEAALNAGATHFVRKDDLPTLKKLVEQYCPKNMYSTEIG